MVMKQKVSLIGSSVFVCVLIFVATVPAVAQAIYQDHFDSMKGWTVISGKWGIENGEMRGEGTQAEVQYCELDEPADLGGDVIYEYDITVQKDTPDFQGVGAHLWQDEENCYGLAEFGGWGNTLLNVRTIINGVTTNHNTVAFSYTAEVKYRLRAVVEGDTVSTYIVEEKDKDEIAEHPMLEVTEAGLGDMRGRFRLNTYHTNAHWDNLIIYGPEGPGPVESQGKLAMCWGRIKYTAKHTR